jgi:hypothetical protein
LPCPVESSGWQAGDKADLTQANTLWQSPWVQWQLINQESQTISPAKKKAKADMSIFDK